MQIDSYRNLSIENLKTRYPVDHKYKLRQKNTSGRLIPFEAIVPELYRANAHCACFITDENRVHAWISAIGNQLYNKYDTPDDNVTIMWEDTDRDNSPMATEFIVCENTDSNSEDDFLYKVIVYLTTGKILVQGKAYNQWCRELFPQCLQKVNELCNCISSSVSESNRNYSGKTPLNSMSKEVGTNQPSNQTNEPETTPADLGVDHEETHVKQLFYTQNGDDNSPCLFDDNESDIHENVPIEEYMNVDKRLDVFEDRLISISEKLSKIISNKDPTVEKLLKKINSMEDNRAKDKKEMLELLQTSVNSKKKQ